MHINSNRNRVSMIFLISVLVLIAVEIFPFVSFSPMKAQAHVNTTTASAPLLHVYLNELEDQNNHLVQLRGVDKYGSEYECVRPKQWQSDSNAPFDGPANQSDINQMLSWDINAVRIPLNEDCWTGANMGPLWHNFGVWNSQTMYIDPITSYVNLLISNGITPILDLYYAAPGNNVPDQGITTAALPDRDHSITFWQEVTTTFGANDAVVFDLYNEPHPDSTNPQPPNPWACWQLGTYQNSTSSCPQGQYGPDKYSYDYAGMQELVNTIRGVVLPGGGNPANVLTLSGLNYAKYFSHWEQYLPSNTTNLAADWHAYQGENECDGGSASCFYNNFLQYFIGDYPVITEEIGEKDKDDGYILPLMQFLDNPQSYGYSFPASSYLAWHWNTNNDGLQLITSYKTPYPPSQCYGQDYHDYLTGTHLTCIPPT